MRLPLKILLILGPLVSLSVVAGGQSVPPLDQIKSRAEFEKAITTLDFEVFDAYNRCDVEKFGSFLADNVEFYHDQGGITVGKAGVVEALKSNICGKVTRELVPDSLQIFLMKGIGALEIGVHRFHHPGHDDTEPVGEGRFVHLWECKDGAWKLTRVFSFDHHALPK